MKAFIVLVFAMLAACVKSDKEMMMKIMQDCKTSVGATDEDLAKFMIHAPPENQPQKCIFSCMMEGMNIVSDTTRD